MLTTCGTGPEEENGKALYFLFVMKNRHSEQFQTVPPEKSSPFYASGVPLLAVLFAQTSLGLGLPLPSWESPQKSAVSPDSATGRTAANVIWTSFLERKEAQPAARLGVL